MNSTGPPGAGNPHARWDEGAPEGIDHAEILRHCQSKEAEPATAQLPPVSSGLYSTSSHCHAEVRNARLGAEESFGEWAHANGHLRRITADPDASRDTPSVGIASCVAMTPEFAASEAEGRRFESFVAH